jgi:hypothetical protein
MSKYIGTKAVNLSTTSADVTGNADIDGNLTVGGNLTVSGTTITVDHATAQTVDLGDNDKIRLGADYELQLWSDGTTGQISGDINHTGSITTDGLTVASNSPQLVLDDVDSNQVLRFSSGSTASYIQAGTDLVSGSAADLNFGSIYGADTWMKIASNGDISFFDDSGNAKFFWDASAESLGIGTTTLTHNLEIREDINGIVGARITNPNSGSSAYSLLYFGSDTNNVHSGIFQNSSTNSNYGGANSLNIWTNSGSYPIAFHTNNAERMRIDGSSGNLLVGTTTNYTKLTVSNGAATRSGITISDTTSASLMMFAGASDNAVIGTDANSLVIRRGMSVGTDNGTETARFDASGNLLVGTTDTQPPTNSDVSGIALRSDGKIAASRDNGIAADFNNNNAGNIAWFRKNGTVVATVSTRTGGGDAPYFGGYTNADTGIAFSSARMYPVTSSGVVANGTRDLGNFDAKWKDLYLSGGIQFDSRSNKLDDYEEGTWTPTVTSGTITNPAGSYTKVGRLVTLIFRWSSITGGSGQLSIGGLPFAKQNGAGFDPASGGCMFDGISTTRGITPYTGGSYIQFYGTASGNADTWWYVNHSDATGSQPLECYGSIWYYTS